MADNIFFPSVVTASDTVDMQAGFFSRVSDAVTKGIPSAAISGAMSVYNTFLDYGGKEAEDTASVIRSFDREMGDYYDQNKDIIDLAGFVGTSLIPGGLGIGALKLARTGQALGPVSRMLNIAATPAQANLTKALKYMGTSGGTLTAEVQAAKRARLAWETADQVLLGAAGELAILSVMNDSPIFENDTAADFAKNVAVGALFGGAVGGVFSFFETRGILKSATKLIEGDKRLFDSVFDPAKLGLKKADEIAIFAENLVKLPDDFYNTTFNYKLGGKQHTQVLDTADAFKTARSGAEKQAYDDLSLKFNELSGGHELTGQAMFDFIKGQITSGRAANKTAESISDTIQGYLQGVKKVSPLDFDSGAVQAPKQFFVTKNPTNFGDLFSEVKTKDTGKQAFYLTTTDPRQIKFGSQAKLGYDDIQQAFDDGYDAVFTKNGKTAINPKSKVIKRTPDQALKSDFYLDLESGSLTNDVILTGGDILRSRGDFKHFGEAASIGGRIFQQAATRAADLEGSSLDASVRFMWASDLKEAAFKDRVIDWSDFALLDRAKEFPNLALKSEVAIKLPDGSLQKLADIVDFPTRVNELKLDFLQDAMNKGKPYDTRHITTHLNVTRDWFERAVTNNFARVPEQLAESRSLSMYFRPQTVKMQWDSEAMQVASQAQGFMGPMHWSNYTLAHHYELQTNLRTQDNAFLAAFGEDAKLFQDADDALIMGVTSEGAGARTVSSSNADYGDRSRLHVQDTGKALALTQQKWRDRDILALSPHINAVRDNKLASAELGVLTTALRRDPNKYHLFEGRLVDRDAIRMLEKEPSSVDSIEEAIELLKQQGRKGEYTIKNNAVHDFLAASRDINKGRLNKKTTLLNAAGLSRKFDEDVIYAPPVDTRRYPFMAFVVAKERIGAITDVSMITAKDEAQLRALVAKVGDDYDVHFDRNTKAWHKAKGTYDYELTINEPKVNSDLQRRGVLGDFFPETRAENVLEDYVMWHGNSSDSIARLGVEVKNRQFLNELNFLSEQHLQAATSTFAGKGKEATGRVADPFGDYRKTMLNLSKQSEYPLLDSLNEFTDRISKQLYSKLDSVRSQILDASGVKAADQIANLEYTNKLMKDAGLNGAYTTIEDLLVANQKYPKNLIRSGVQKVNYWLATTSLRLDLANSIVNTISTPIMLGTELSSIKTLIGQDSALAGKLLELTHLAVPGTTYSMPSTTRLIGNAVKNYFGPEKELLLQRFTENGDIKGIATLYHEVLDDLAYNPNIKQVGKWQAQIDKAVAKGSRISGADFAEEFTRFVSADVMRQLSQPVVDAGKMTIKEQNAYISSFVNRVQGNYISSQRPVIFQGTVGAAISLFQTYSFNVLQQLTRHMENADKRTLAVFGGLQSSIYGLNGLPFFDAVNTHLIGTASGNPQHHDVASALAGKQIGEWMLYGTASAFPLFGDKSPALYSRGDINPRHATILPILPWDVPAVQASIKLVDSVVNFAKQAGGGADLSTSFLQALEHQGWSRPLAGFAQLLAGEATTSKGSLISAANDLETTSWLSRIPSRLINYGGVTRLMGAKPMDEAVSLDAMYRTKAYDAIDRQRIEALGEVVKTKLGNNQMPDDDELHEFMTSYINSGGRQETFSRSMQRWSRDANESVVNQLSGKLGNHSNRQLQQLLGSTPLQDYSTIAAQPAVVPPEE